MRSFPDPGPQGLHAARPGQAGFVGGSMGDKSVTLEGVESPDANASLQSTVHGAGRVMSPAWTTLCRMDDKVNLAEKVGLLDSPYRPGVIGSLNDYKLVVVRVKGEFVWHKHDDTDDFFLVLRGHLTIQLRDRDIELDEGEVFVVPRGVEHCPKAEEEAHVLLIEPKGTVNTGDAGGELTAEEVEI